MKNSALIGASVVLLALAGIVSVTWWKSRDSNTVENDSSAAAEAVASQAPPPATSTTGPRQTRRPVALSGQARHARRQMQQQAAQRVVEAGRQKLTRQYQMERVDGKWALPKEQTLERLSTSPQIDELDAEPTAMTVQCRTSVCHVVATFPNNRAADDWFSLYPMNVGMEMPNISQQRSTNPDGTVRVELYGLARP
jgi:hypothetical protein